MLVPIFLLGFAQSALYVWLVIIGLHATLDHVNLRFRMRWIEQLLVTPRFHHWHHAVEPAGPQFRRALSRGSTACSGPSPAGRRLAARYGLAGDPVPKATSAQLVYPLRRDSASSQR